MRRSTIPILLSLLVFGVSLTAAAGEHKGLGQKAGLNITTVFLNPSGHTYTDQAGIHYNIFDYYLTSEGLYYKSSTWGTLYPLFFLGDTVQFTVNISNVAPGAKRYRIHVKGYANDLRPPFVIGAPLMQRKDWVVEVANGETKLLYGEIPLIDPSTPSGLDIVRLEVFNEDMGQGKNNDLIGTWEAIFCPPHRPDGL